MPDQPIESPEATMARIQSEVAAKAGMQETQQETLSNVLKSPEEGGSNIGLPAGTDVPKALEANPATRQLIEEAIAIQTGKKTQTSETAREALDESQKIIDQDRLDYQPYNGQIKERTQKYPQGEAISTGTLSVENVGIPSGTTDTSGLTPEQADLFNRIQQLNQTTYDQTVANIQRNVQEQTQAAQSAQKIASGASRAQLARMGALNVTSAGIQYMNDLNNQHVAELNKITRAGLDALNEAQRAKEGGDLELLSKKLDAVRQNKLDIQQANANYLNELQTMAQISKLQRDSVSESINAMVSAGFDPDTIPQGLLETYDVKAGYLPGTTRGMMEMAQMEQYAAVETNNMDRATKMVDLLNKIPYGEPITIGESTYYGMKSNDLDWKLEVDNTGRGTAVVFDPLTGGFSTQNLGYIGSPKNNFQLQFDGEGKPWNFDPTTGQLFYAGPSSANYSGVIPDGTDFNWADPEGGYFTGECGEFIRWYSNGSVRVGNSLEEKKAIIDDSIGGKDNPVQVGDIVVQNIGGWTGHIAVVNSVETDSNTGKTIIRLTEANRNNDGKITNTAQVALDSSTIVGFARPPEINFDMAVGTDIRTAPEFTPKVDIKPDLVQDGQPYKLVNGVYKPITVEKTPAQIEAETLKKSEEYKNQLLVQQDLNQRLDTINSVLDSNALSLMVGPNFLSRRSILNAAAYSNFSGEADLIASKVKQITSQETLNALINAKAKGATFGALSEGELKILSDSATILNDATKTNSLGQTYFDMSEAAFKEELNRFKTMAKKAFDISNGNILPTKKLMVEFFGEPNPGEVFAKNIETGEYAVVTKDELTKGSFIEIR